MSRPPVPAAVFWRRRLLVVAVVIGAVWLAVTLAPFGGEDPVATPVNAPKVTAAAVPADGTFEVALSTSAKRCDPQQVRVNPSVPTGQKVRGAVPIDLVVSSTSTTSCTLQPKDADMIAIISAGSTPVWDSTRCATSLLTDPVVISARWSTRVQTSWTGRRSGGTCSSKEAWASPGRYTMKIGTLGGEPGEVTFDLAPRPAPEPSATPTKKSDEKSDTKKSDSKKSKKSGDD